MGILLFVVVMVAKSGKSGSVTGGYGGFGGGCGSSCGGGCGDDNCRKCNPDEKW